MAKKSGLTSLGIVRPQFIVETGCEVAADSTLRSWIPDPPSHDCHSSLSEMILDLGALAKKQPSEPAKAGTATYDSV
jgi:hypothetical protein